MSYDTFDPQPQQEKRSGSGCVKGCLIALAIALVCALLLGWWVSNNWRDWVSSFAAQGVDAMIDESDLPAQEKAELKVEAKRVTDGIADGSISAEQLEQLMDGLATSPLVPMFIVSAVETKYLDSSGLSDDEKAAGKVTLERYARGLVDKQIPRESADRVLVHIADKGPDGEWQLREQVSDDQLRNFLAAAKQEADQANIPDEVTPIDPSAELKKVIDSALGPAPEAAVPAE